MSIDEKLDEALQYLADSRNKLKNGEVVVLEGFQNDVRLICNDISAMPVGDMQKFSAKLETLSEQLKILEQELRSQQTLVQQDIFSLNRKQKALQTYQTVSHSHKDEEGEA